MKKRIPLLLLCLLLSALVVLSGCNKQEPDAPEQNDKPTGSQTTTDKPTDKDPASAKVELATGNGWTVSGDMSVVVSEESEKDSWSGYIDPAYSEYVLFTTEKEVDGGTIRISGSLFIGSEARMLDLDEEAFWTEEDYEKAMNDPDYAPEIPLPTPTELLETSLSSMETRLPGKELKLGEITLQQEAGTVVSADGRSMVANLCAAGEAGEQICFINIGMEAFGCADNGAQIDAGIALAEQWLSTITIEASEVIDLSAAEETEIAE